MMIGSRAVIISPGARTRVHSSLKHQLHKDQELFYKAYGHIGEYY